MQVKLTITVPVNENEQAGSELNVEKILYLLEEAELGGLLDFPFSVHRELPNVLNLARKALAEASISIACALDETPTVEDLEHIQSKITEVENLIAPIEGQDPNHPYFQDHTDA